MGPLIITILLGLASTSFQKSLKSNDLQESPELEAFLQTLITEGRGSYYKDANLKVNINKNKKKTKKDVTEVQYLGEMSSEKEPTGFKNLNKNLAKFLDGLQQRVLNEETKDPRCTCDYASEHWPGVIKCQCGSSVRVDDNADSEEESGEAERQYHDYKHANYKQDDDRLDEESRHNQKHEDRREDRSDEDQQEKYRQLARFSKGDIIEDRETLGRLSVSRDNDREEGYWTDDTSCGCNLLRNVDDEKDTHYLRCKCNSPERIGSKADSTYDREEGYWTDDTSCGCNLLRNNDDNSDITHFLKCGCNSPTRVGNEHNDDSDEIYWSGENRCECNLLRNVDYEKDIRYLRCKCKSPARVGSIADTKYDRDEGYWTDDTSCGCNLLRNTDDNRDITHFLKCGCNSATRVGDDKEDDRDDGYWPGNDSCECKLLRNVDGDKDVHYLRCRCDSPERVGSKADTKYDRNEGYWTDDTTGCGCESLRNIVDKKDRKNLRCRCSSPFRAERFDTMLSDLSDADIGNYESRNLDRNINEHKLNNLIDFILKKDNNIDLSQIPSKKRKFLIKLRDIMPSLRNIDTYKLQSKIESILDENDNTLRETIKKESKMENPLTAEQIQRLLKLIEQQKTAKDNEQMYRRSLPEDPIGVPFTYQLQGLAQVNNQ